MARYLPLIVGIILGVVQNSETSLADRSVSLAKLARLSWVNYFALSEYFMNFKQLR